MAVIGFTPPVLKLFELLHHLFQTLLFWGSFFHISGLKSNFDENYCNYHVLLKTSTFNCISFLAIKAKIVV